MTGNHLFRSSAIALLALIARGGAAAWGQAPAAPPPIKMRYDEDAKTGYSVSNSDRLLKVRLWIADPLQQAKIMENGLELWIDTKGKKNKITGILYPLPVAKAPGPASPAEASAKAQKYNRCSMSRTYPGQGQAQLSARRLHCRYCQRLS
ncbi:MAG TPA: hypothetical protein VLD19_14685 [Chitinophagaceae bacterium]|nr:hypothetical protein [Chitinophagaceae bacterium]